MIVPTDRKQYIFSRPGRPPKRMTPITTFASMPTHTDPAFLGAMASGIPFPPPQQPRAQELPPGFNPFLPLGGSPGQAAQMAQHAQVCPLSSVHQGCRRNFTKVFTMRLALPNIEKLS